MDKGDVFDEVVRRIQKHLQRQLGMGKMQANSVAVNIAGKAGKAGKQVDETIPQKTPALGGQNLNAAERQQANVEIMYSTIETMMQMIANVNEKTDRFGRAVMNRNTRGRANQRIGNQR